MPSTYMHDILERLDNILTKVASLTNASHVTKRGSLQDDCFSSIKDDVNNIKNNIILHLFESRVSDNTKETNALIKPKPLNGNKLIVPLPKKPENLSYTDEQKFNSDAVKDVEIKVSKALNESNTYAMVTSKNVTDKGNIVFKFSSSSNINSIEESLKQDLGNNIRINKPIQPKMTITNVPLSYDFSDKSKCKNDILNANAALKNYLDSSKSNFDVLFMYTTNYTNNIVIKCDSDVRDHIINNNRTLRLGSIECVARDRVYIPRCTNCAKIGHTTNSCKNSNCCFRCGNAHNGKTCSVATLCCINCKTSQNENIKTNAHSHGSLNNNCPEYQSMLKNVCNKTNWGAHTPDIRI